MFIMDIDRDGSVRINLFLLLTIFVNLANYRYFFAHFCQFLPIVRYNEDKYRPSLDVGAVSAGHVRKAVPVSNQRHGEW